ncbi:MAG: pseudaminic acid cytidylyltransferase [Methylobacter sp.]|nr:pseudaminic acid cytidylyltransferase [Methylobacter sp.]MDP2097072.1 pseudaminic acid cytidylyltransferase [Methylobacter sp.]MDP2428010.1 pseudaminic acid cytidylyltransferase [Methylobacter sp.]MDP3055906.1 pseudaminic acid cytidylyltransferase [Methylobacter sp.]MDP3363064.1 pseudaminic acid cytidylyltransferase [Methylobacter sp.]
MKIAIIPARGGSKRIPRKNIKLFYGKPMIAWAIETAKASGLFEHIVVSTDDAEISALAKNWGAEAPFVRPAELADDYTPTVPVVAHAISACQALGWQVDQVCCIYPAVPFMQCADLAAALHKLEAGNADYVFPIAAYPSAIQRALRQLPNGLMEPFYSQYASTRTQDLEPAYYDAGQFYWGRAQAWLAEKNIHQHGAGLEIPSWRVVDIDNTEDWQRAELMLAAFNSA